MQSECLWGVHSWQFLYEGHVLLYLLTAWDLVVSVELEGLWENVLSEPNLEIERAKHCHIQY